jgi:spore germination protein GerM
MSKRNLTLTVIIIAALVAAGVVAFLYQRPVSTPAPTGEQPTQTTQPGEQEQTKEPTQYPVKVYFSKHPESDEDPTRVFSFDRVSPDSGVGTYAIKQLLAGPTASERQAGYFSNVKVRDDASNCGGADFTLKIEQGTATLQFCRTFDAIGTISDGQAEQTILATLRQFSTVKKVVILSKDGHCQFDLSGEDRCKQP